MSRSSSALVALTALAALSFAACGGGPAASQIADPKEILVKAVEVAQQAKAVHVKVEVKGKFAIGDLSGLLGGSLPGLPGASGAASASPSSPASSPASLDLTGTTLEGDVDVVNGRAHLAFLAPTLLSLTGDLIASDGAVYLKVSMLGDKYQRFGLAGGTAASPAPSPSLAPSPSPTASVGDQLRAQLGKLKNPPRKLDDQRCGDTDCYHVQVTLDAADTAPLASMAPGVTGTGTLDVYVRKNDLRPSQLVLTGESGTASGLTLTVTLSGWDASVDIKAPPADQVSDTGGFSIPSFAVPSFASPSP
jgi:hypothetical protein